MLSTPGRSGTNWTITIFVLLIFIGLVFFFTFPANTPFKSYERIILGRKVSLVIGTRGNHDDLAQIGFEEFERVLKKYSHFEEFSVISSLNTKRISLQEIDIETLSLFRKLIELSEKTLWNYDFTIGNFYIRFFKSNSQIGPLYPAEILEENGKQKIRIEENRVVADDTVSFFLGRALRGYAMDQVFATIRNTDNELKGYIQVEEDVLIFGPKSSGSAWILALKFENAESPPLYMTLGALFQQIQAVNPDSFVQIEDKVVLHPVTAELLAPYALSAIIAPTALEAAVLIVAAQSLQPEFLLEKMALWKSHAYLLRKDGQEYKSSLWQQFFVN